MQSLTRALLTTAVRYMVENKIEITELFRWTAQRKPSKKPTIVVRGFKTTDSDLSRITIENGYHRIEIEYTKIVPAACFIREFYDGDPAIRSMEPSVPVRALSSYILVAEKHRREEPITEG